MSEEEKELPPWLTKELLQYLLTNDIVKNSPKQDVNNKWIDKQLDKLETTNENVLSVEIPDNITSNEANIRKTLDAVRIESENPDAINKTALFNRQELQIGTETLIGIGLKSQDLTPNLNANIEERVDSTLRRGNLLDFVVPEDNYIFLPASTIDRSSINVIKLDEVYNENKKPLISFNEFKLEVPSKLTTNSSFRTSNVRKLEDTTRLLNKDSIDPEELNNFLELLKTQNLLNLGRAKQGQFTTDKIRKIVQQFDLPVSASKSKPKLIETLNRFLKRSSRCE